MSGSTTPQPPIKRVRVGETSVIGTHSTVTDSGRPKRSSVGEPDYYSTKRPKSASAKHAEMEAATTPTKTSPTSTPTRKYKKKGATKLFGKRKASDTAKAEAETTEAAKPKRGRPKTVNALAKASVGKETTAAPKKTAGRPKKIVQNVKSTKPATGRGRPPKHVVNHDDEEEAEDDVAVANGTSNEVGEDEEDENADSGRQYWLMKAEPDSRIENGVDVKFSIDDLKSRNEAEAWDGVRNYVARNNMRAMRKGDLAFFYHSNCKVPGIAGVMRVVDEHRVDGMISSSSKLSGFSSINT